MPSSVDTIDWVIQTFSPVLLTFVVFFLYILLVAYYCRWQNKNKMLKKKKWMSIYQTNLYVTSEPLDGIERAHITPPTLPIFCHLPVKRRGTSLNPKSGFDKGLSNICISDPGRFYSGSPWFLFVNIFIILLLWTLRAEPPPSYRGWQIFEFTIYLLCCSYKIYCCSSIRKDTWLSCCPIQ
jgi:hypothetical protein